MNCWEMVLFAGYKAGEIDQDWIKGFYETASAAQDPNQSIWEQLGAFDARSESDYTPESGDFIFFAEEGDSYPGHIALSLGQSGVISLWTGPDGTNSVQRTTINKIENMMVTSNTKVEVTAGSSPVK